MAYDFGGCQRIRPSREEPSQADFDEIKLHQDVTVNRDYHGGHRDGVTASRRQGNRMLIRRRFDLDDFFEESRIPGCG